MTISRTRGGKGVSCVIPNLLDHPGSVFCTDIKGELLAITGKHRRQYGAVYPIAPFAEHSARLNPLDFIRRGTSEFDDAMLVATLIVTPSPKGDDAFWDREARTLISMMIQFVIKHRDHQDQTLAEVRRLLMLSTEKFDELLDEMSVSPYAEIRSNAEAFSQKEPKERSGVISTAQSHTRFLDSKRVQAVTNRSDFTFTALKYEVTSVYLILPLHQIAAYRPFMRLMVGLATAAMTRIRHELSEPVLFLLDEFPSLGKMPISAVAYLAGYDVRLWFFTQSLAQLEAVYGKSGLNTILSNCAVTQMWSVAPADYETAEHLSKVLGENTVASYSRSKSSDKPMALLPHQWSEQASRKIKRLMSPDELLCLPAHLMVLLVAGSRPYLVQRVIYYKDKLFAGKFGTWRG